MADPSPPYSTTPSPPLSGSPPSPTRTPRSRLTRPPPAAFLKFLDSLGPPAASLPHQSSSSETESNGSASPIDGAIVTEAQKGAGASPTTTASSSVPPWQQRSPSPSNHPFINLPPNHFLSQQQHRQEDFFFSTRRSTEQVAGASNTAFSFSFSTTVEETDEEPELELIPLNPSPAVANAITITRDGSQPQAHQSPQSQPAALPTTGRPDTSSLAAADFDVDVRSGFLPPSEPLTRLEGKGLEDWERWEVLLERASLGEECFLEGWWPGKDEDLVDVNDDSGNGLIQKREEERKESSRLWRRDVDRMGKVDLRAVAHDLRILRRAYSILAFISHFYVHSVGAADDEKDRRTASASTTTRTEGEKERVLKVPKSLARPFWDVSARLGLPPVLTYSATVLWNWRLRDPSLGYHPDNFQILTTFTPKSSEPSQVTAEEGFYLTSLHCELFGPLILSNMRSSLLETFVSDSLSRRRISSHLFGISELVKQMTIRMAQTVKLVDPAEFYWRIRKWFNGGKWRFEGVGLQEDGDEEGVDVDTEVELDGPSAGQSSLVHSVDVFLGIDQTPRGDDGPITASQAPANETPTNHPVDANSQQPQPQISIHDRSFMVRMSSFMPRHHRLFLQHLADPSATSTVRTPTVRELVIEEALAAADDVYCDGGRERDEMILDFGLRKSYNDVLMAVKLFRDEHMKIVAKFIISQAHKGPPPRRLPQTANAVAATSTISSKGKAKARDDTTSLTSEKGPTKKPGELKGTGGTDLVRFLKLSRERTLEAVVPENGSGSESD